MQNQITIDGSLSVNEWHGDTVQFEKVANFFLNFDERFLYVGGIINDDSPLSNTKNNSEI